jgi:hypothetical protein
VERDLFKLNFIFKLHYFAYKSIFLMRLTFFSMNKNIYSGVENFCFSLLARIIMPHARLKHNWMKKNILFFSCEAMHYFSCLRENNENVHTHTGDVRGRERAFTHTSDNMCEKKFLGQSFSIDRHRLHLTQQLWWWFLYFIKIKQFWLKWEFYFC